MDNFTIWVDAPSEALIETPLDDESSCFLRDEILQTQQYVIEKLDEQKVSEQEKSEQSDKESEQECQLSSQVKAEWQELVQISRQLAVLKDACSSNDVHLMAIKKSFSDSAKIIKENHEKILFEINNEVTLFQDTLKTRRSSLNNIKNERNRDGEEAKKECKRLRDLVMKAKQKHENLALLHASVSKLRDQYDHVLIRQNAERELIEAQKTALNAQQEYVEQMKEECVNLRSQLIHLEALRFQNQSDVDNSEIERIQKETESVRIETEELAKTLANIRTDKEEAQNKFEACKQEEIENEALIKERKQAIVELLRRKIGDVKKKAGKRPEVKKASDLKKAISLENEKLEQLNREKNEINPENKNIDGLLIEVAAMKSTIRDYDRQIKEASKKNTSLVEKISQMNPSFGRTPICPNLNDTAELQTSYIDRDNHQTPLEVTSVHRHLSHDVFIGPIMTSTPLHKQPKRTAKTQAAARRLEKVAAAKTAEIRKRRAGKK